MNRRKVRSLGENIAGIITAGLGVTVLAILFWYKHEVILQVISAGNQPSSVKPVQATVIDAQTLQQQLQNLEAQKQAQEQARLDALAQAKAAKNVAEEEARRQTEAAKQAELAAKAAQEQAQKDKLAAEQAALQAEKERLAREQAISEKEIAEQKAQALQQQAAEEEAKRKAAEEAKRKAEEEAKRKAAEEAKRKAEEEAAAAAKLAQLDAPSLGDTISSLESGARQAQDNAVNRFASNFGVKMESNWRLPPNIPEGLSALIFLRFGADGRLVEVKIERSSGYPLYDNAAIEAAYAAAPATLPMNADAAKYLMNEGMTVRFNP